ncbi:MAG: PAS domain-containing protein [Ahrensia sp.]|nr:PAS domain-containing protein [Ahrensia sp.]
MTEPTDPSGSVQTDHDADKLLHELFSKYPDSTHLWAQSMNQTRMAMSISDPHQSDNPLVYVNRAFCDLTGYEPEEVIGRNCRFLQGDETSVVKRMAIRNLLKNHGTGIVELVNYRKDGTKFWNALHLSPLKDKHGTTRFFFGSQWNVSDEVAAKAADDQFKTINRELNHHVMNILAVVSSLVTMSATESVNAAVMAKKTRERISALATAHRAAMDWSTRNELISLRQLIKAQMDNYCHQAGREISLEGDDIHLNPDQITPMALIVHELVANSSSYGFLAGHARGSEITWAQQRGPSPAESQLALTWRECEVDGDADISGANGAGTRIMHAMLVQVGGEMQRVMDGRDYVVTLSFPMVQTL